MRQRAVLMFVVVMLALVLAGCGSAGSSSGSGSSAPRLGELIGSSLKAAGDQKDTSAHYELVLKVDAHPSSSASKETRDFTTSPIELRASGGAAAHTLTFDGELGLMGQTFRARALAGAHEAYVQLLGRWYGDRANGLDDLDAQAKSTSKDEEAELKRALSWLHDHGGELFDARVTSGPDIDGATWQAQGHCRPEGVAALIRDNGGTVSASDRDDIKTFCDVVDFSYAVGQDDRMPRELRVTTDLDSKTLAQIAAAGFAGDTFDLRELDRLRLEFDLKLTKWGEPVTYQAPSDVRPMDDVGQALFGLLMSATAAGMAGS